MKITDIKIIDKGALRVAFTVESGGLTIRDCKLFEKDGHQWIGGPSRQYTNADGETKYFEQVKFDDSAQSKVLSAISAALGSSEPQTRQESSAPRKQQVKNDFYDDPVPF